MINNLSPIFLVLLATIQVQTLYPSVQPKTLNDCPIYDLPVCGKDHKTYQNSCFLSKAGVEKAYDGWCNNKTPTPNPQTPGSQDNFNDHTEANGYLPGNKPYLQCPCNTNFRPVCGINGITYANACRATCKSIPIVSYGECRLFNVELPERETCQCDYDNISVCADNTVSYENICVARCFNATIERTGICSSPCSCQFYYKPVCGENGYNYVNQCELDCAGVNKYSDGMCSEASKCNHCFGSIKRVCGKDENTYDNECYALCAGTTVEHQGHCVNKDNGNCLCSSIYLPVCGTDDVTYSNECELNCAGTTLKKFGKCRSDDKDDNKCRNNCYKLEYKPVCGTNTVTYYNKEMIGCDSGITVLYEGECKPIYIPNCKCPTNLDPVCGVDGKTYYNKCVADYVGVEVYCDGTCELDGNGWRMIKTKYPSDSSDDVYRSYKPDSRKHENRYDPNAYVVDSWYNPNECRGNKCNDKKNRCCDINRSRCCMREDGRCCNDDDDDDDYRKDWDHKPQNCEWKCDNRNNSCKPHIKIPYILVEKPCKLQTCKAPVKPVIHCKLPPVPNSEQFNYHTLGIYYPFIGNFFPYPNHIEDCLANGFGLPKNNKGSSGLFDTLFRNNNNVSVTSINIDISIDIDINYKSYDFKNKKKQEIDRCIKKIPAEDKQVIYQHATLYYVYFYVLLKQDLCDQDTEVYSGYTVKDILLYIIRDCWGLQLDEGDDDNTYGSYSVGNRDNYRDDNKFSMGIDDEDVFNRLSKYMDNKMNGLDFYGDGRGWKSGLIGRASPYP